MEENEELLESTNEIIEITDTEEEPVYDEVKIETKEEQKKNKKKDKKKLPKWNELSKKQKIIFIVVVCVVVLIIIGLVLFFCLKKDKKEEVKEPDVILEKGNYRYENGKLVFLNTNKDEIGSYECVNKDENKCYIANYSGEDDFDTVKRVYEKNNKGVEQASDIFNKKYVFIYDNATKENELLILYDLETKKEEGKYQAVKKYDDNSVIVRDEEEKYGLLSLTDEVKEKIDFKYDYLGKVLEKDAIVAKTGNNSLLIDTEGKELSKAIKGDIKNYSDKYISIAIDEAYSLYDYEGQKVLEQDNDYITFKDEYVFIIDSKKLYAYDADLNLLNYDGIKINATNYNKTIYYDEKLKETKRDDSFTIEVGSGTIAISEGKTKNEINVYEGKLSGKYKYVSYLNGTIYIYRDEAKTSLLGTYTCKNKNDVTKNSTEFDKCFIARETKLLNNSNNSKELGFLPVVNSRYAFINDTSSAKDSNAILYDLSTKKDRGTYKQVDVGYYKNDFGYMNSASIYFMAKNSKDYYGIVKLEATNATKIIEFEGTKAIKYLNNDFLVQRDKYYLYNNKGEELASASSEIVELGESALIVKSGNSYNVISNTKGSEGQIYKANLVYVKLEKNYFIGVDDAHKVNVYRYEKDATGCLDPEDLPTTNNYDKIIPGDNNIIVDGKSYSFSLGEEDAN